MVAVTYRSSAGQRHRHTPAGSALTFWCVLMSGPFTSGCPAQCAALHYSMLMVFISDLVLDTNLCSEFWLYTVETEVKLPPFSSNLKLHFPQKWTRSWPAVCVESVRVHQQRIQTDFCQIWTSLAEVFFMWDETSRHSNNPLDPVLTQKTLSSFTLSFSVSGVICTKRKFFFYWMLKDK